MATRRVADVAGARLSPRRDVETGPRFGGSAVNVSRPLPPTGAAAGLAWHPTADAVSYRLEVIDEAGPR
jgi:hypothetical protein